MTAVLLKAIRDLRRRLFAADYLTIGGMGGLSSLRTHEDRSNSMNSIAAVGSRRAPWTSSVIWRRKRCTSMLGMH